MKNTMPFEPDAPKPANPVDQAELAFRQAYEREKTESRNAWIAESEQAWTDYETARRTKFIKNYRYENSWEPPPYRYETWTRAEIYRVSLPKDTRLQTLLDAGYYSESLKVWLYRRGSDASIAEVKDFLRPCLNVDGNEVMTHLYIEDSDVCHETMDGEDVVDAEGLSVSLCYILREGLSVRNGRVSFSVRTDKNARDIPAHLDKTLDPEEF